jgi:hypothetical protein
LRKRACCGGSAAGVQAQYLRHAAVLCRHGYLAMKLDQRLHPEKLREMAFGLLDLADSLETEDGADTGRNANLGQSVDQLAPLLASVARIEYRARGYRSVFFDSDLFGEPAWDMLLDLFIETVEGRKVAVTSLCIASRAPSTTALRYVNELEKRGILIREKSRFDQRTSYLGLSPDAFLKIGNYLKQRYSAFGFAKLIDMGEVDTILGPEFAESA